MNQSKYLSHMLGDFIIVFVFIVLFICVIVWGSKEKK